MSSLPPNDDVYIISAEYKDLLTAVFKSTIFYSIWNGASILMFLTFLLLSTTAQRKTCIFYLLSGTFVMLLTTSISVLVKDNIIRQDIFVQSLDRGKAEKKILQRSAALLLMERITCLMADMALICKLRSFYPIPIYSSRQRWFNVAPLLVLIPPRLVAIASLPAAHMTKRYQVELRINITEYSLQMLWCTFATSILFYKSFRFYQQAAVRGDERLKRKLRILMESILCTFLVPIICQIICLVLLCIEAIMGPNSKLHELFATTNACNLFTSVHCALLSTTWSAIRDRSDRASSKQADAVGPTLVTSFFASVSTASLELQDYTD